MFPLQYIATLLLTYIGEKVIMARAWICHYIIVSGVLSRIDG